MYEFVKDMDKSSMNCAIEINKGSDFDCMIFREIKGLKCKL